MDVPNDHYDDSDCLNDDDQNRTSSTMVKKVPSIHEELHVK